MLRLLCLPFALAASAHLAAGSHAPFSHPGLGIVVTSAATASRAPGVLPVAPGAKTESPWLLDGGVEPNALAPPPMPASVRATGDATRPAPDRTRLGVFSAAFAIFFAVGVMTALH